MVSFEKTNYTKSTHIEKKMALHFYFI